MRARFLSCILLVLFLPGFVIFTRQEWKINDHFTIRFSDRFADGVFEDLKGSVFFDTSDLAHSRFDVTVDVKSINTGNKLKNKHAQGPKWFDSEKYPAIRFVSDSIYKKDSIYMSSGTLEIKGITQKTDIPFKFSSTGDSAVFSSTFSIDRTAFQIGKRKGDTRDSTILTIIVPATKTDH